jgi:hypothetical protein
MALPYYVEPEYWEEGYAEGDAKLVAASTQLSLDVSGDILRIFDVSAAIAADMTAATSAEIIYLVQAQATPAASFSADINRIQPGAATATATSSTTASATRVLLGSATIGCSATFAATVVAIQNVSASISVTGLFDASALVLLNASASTSAAVSAVVDALRVRLVSSGLNYYVETGYWEDGYADRDAIQVTSRATAIRTTSAAASILAQLGFTAASSLLLSTSASIAINAIFAANVRLKWEPEPDTPETWNDIAETTETWSAIAQTSETWTNISDTSNIWTDVPDTSETWTET